MKIFVAGIRFANKYKAKPTAYKTRWLVNMLSEVMADAAKACGDDCLVVVALHEYALVDAAITVEEKDASIAVLRMFVEKWPNLVLIPGSYAAMQKLANDENGRRKQNKITQSYSTLFTHPEYSKDKQFMEERAAYQKYLDSGEVDKKIILQNSTYLLTANDKVKHKKSFPYDERYKLLGKHKGVLAIGNVSPVKKVCVAGHELEMGIVICREHLSHANIQELNKNPPFIQVIISDSVAVKVGNLYGALTIHMDSFTGLDLYFNSGHNCAAFIETVKGMEYILDKPAVMKATVNCMIDLNNSIHGLEPIKIAKEQPAEVEASQSKAEDDFSFASCAIY